MKDTLRFAFSPSQQDLGNVLPFLPLRLSYRGKALDTSALLDTGATVNVLPYNIGRELGINWEQQTMPVKLAGNLANLPAKALLVETTVESPPESRKRQYIREC
ncbi:MAG: hypothetical protein GY862_19340 [Gammaproteobacteria bacterium]|nr:hypothetical protein [Gammaproteobacteria bacterium]